MIDIPKFKFRIDFLESGKWCAGAVFELLETQAKGWFNRTAGQGRDECRLVKFDEVSREWKEVEN